ncbi:Mg2 transporter protein CorA family protein [Ruminiclostridium papyrosolvens DSM 2782]|uniref:Mg2 transporter protein CorA family protein n=1 Tax=Ruminiclostridium papyrosolvens DSM 2782 TaxID=588581 RepID=F1TAB4_9FIRM|nr:magnesium transporter CorA family protein [Ruminiclostridium papyrosolvens]EGD48457.1 Mg2 transporter protein CorA family protein [Ruminiclostridium papyrosolvens DSM 2782]WES32785.1 magnesium transporter CorA family protein [Ruminiclostridium papyrosolvens DSM 2782]
MIEIYKTVNNEIVRTETFEDGVWVNLINPTEEEIVKVHNTLGVEMDFLKAALDEEERARIESDNGQTLIIVDVPIVEKEAKLNVYTTIPLAIILIKHMIITVCLKEDTILNDFANNRVKSFLTQFKTRFVLQILYRNATRYLQYLKHIDKTSSRVEQEVYKSMKNKEVIQMLKLEKSLVYFSTALKSNEVVLEKLMKFEYIKNYPEDQELLEDVIIENKQAIEMANIYSSILSGTMDAFASVISNNLNIVMKFLTSVTIVMAIPTMISSFFGMNVDLPLRGGHSFWFIVIIAVVMCMVTGYTLYKKKLF